MDVENSNFFLIDRGGSPRKPGNMLYFRNSKASPARRSPLARIKLIHAAALAVVTSLSATCAQAQTTWAAAGSGTFENAANWSNGIPNGSVTAYLPSAATGEITLDQSEAVGNLIAANTSTLGFDSAGSVANTLTVENLSASAGPVQFYNGPANLSLIITGSAASAGAELDFGISSVALSSLVIEGLTTSSGAITFNAANADLAGGLLLNGASTVQIDAYATGSGGITTTFLSGANVAATVETGASNAASGTLTIAGTGGTQTFAGILADGNGSSNSLSLVETGAGTQILSGNSTYTGSTTVNGGTLQLTGALSSSSTLAVGGGTFIYANPGGASTQAVKGLTINAGASSISNIVSGDTLAVGAITRNLGGTLDFTTTSGAIKTTSTNINGVLLGGDITVGGTTWAVGSANGSSTTITGLGGTTSNKTLGTSYFLLSTAGNTASKFNSTAGTVNVDVDESSPGAMTSSVTFNTLRFNDPGAFTVETAASASHVLTVNGGILVTNNVGANLSQIWGGTTTAIAGLLQGSAGGDLAIIQNNTSGGLLITAAIQDNGSATGLTKSGAGTLTLTPAGAGNTYSGETWVNAGTLQTGGTAALGNTGGITVATGATLDLDGNTPSANASLSLAGSGINGVGALTNSSATAARYGGALALSGATTIGGVGNITLSGAVSGAYGLTIAGAGNVILSASNSYTGPTVVSSGGLIVTGSINGASAVTVNTGATLGGSGDIAGAVSIQANGTLSPGAALSGSAVTLTLGSTLSLSSSATIALNFSASGKIDQINLAGGLTLGSLDSLTIDLIGTPNAGTTYDFLDAANGNAGGNFLTTANLTGSNAAGYTAAVGYDAVNSEYAVTFATVPEPQTWAALLFGMVFLCAIHRRRALRRSSGGKGPSTLDV